MVENVKGEDIEQKCKGDCNDFWEITQDYGNEIDCKISSKPRCWWKKMKFFANENILDKYIDTYKKIEDYYYSNNKADGRLQAIRAIRALYKADNDTRAFFWGFFLGVVGLGIAIIMYFHGNDENMFRSLFCIFILLVVSLLAFSYLLKNVSIKQSAVNDAVEAFERQEPRIRNIKNIKEAKQDK